MAGYGQFCPLAQATEVLGERWTPLVLRELLDGPAGYNDIHRGLPLMSSSLLSSRLRKLERAGVIERAAREHKPGHHYRLTAAGRELAPVLADLAVWGERWVRRDVTPEDADPRYLMWTIRGCVVTDAIEPGRTVAHFRFPPAAGKLRYWWLVLEPEAVDLCLTDPGFEIDLTVEADPVTLAEVVAGDRELGAALREGDVTLVGPRRARRAFRRWFGVSPTAAVERVRTARA